jgi:hypothetical protein
VIQRSGKRVVVVYLLASKFKTPEQYRYSDPEERTRRKQLHNIASV